MAHRLSFFRLGLLALGCGWLVLLPVVGRAQTAPEIGFSYPAGGRAGTVVDVRLGGYDWTPDMQLFVHDPRIKLEIIGPSSPVLMPDPPYWFGAKGRGPAWPLAREFPARLTIPADVQPGVIRWQAANANGPSPVGFLHISAALEVTEDARHTAPQRLPALPVVVNGRIRQIEEVDQYEFTTPKTGPVTIELIARQLNSPLHAMLQVRDAAGKLLLDAADTEGRDLIATFVAVAEAKYIVTLHDLDFAGDRSYVYRLQISAAPQVQAAFPAAGTRGETRKVEFVGVGVATGAMALETVTRDVPFPAAPEVTSFPYRLETPFGVAPAFNLLVSDLPELAASASAQPQPLAPLPTAITGAMETRFGADRYALTLKKDEKWKMAAQSRGAAFPLDLDLTLLGPDGKELAASDDIPGATDAMILFAVPADGAYQLVVADRSGKSGARNACYRLSIEPQREDFTLTFPPLLSIPLGGAIKFNIAVTRLGGFKEPLQFALTGLPEAVKLPADLTIPADKNELALELTCPADAPATAALASLAVTTKLNGQPVTRPAGPMLLAVVMKPRVKITPEGLDDVRKVHRGSTFLAPLLIERLEGYQGEVTLEMTAKQQRHRQGLGSDEFIAPPTATRVEYPIFVPEWMETTKTSRMILNGVVTVPDPKGKVRTLVQRMELRIGILPEGALMKLSSAGGERDAPPGSDISMPLLLSRAPEFRESAKIELLASEAQAGLVTADAVTLSATDASANLVVRLANDPRIHGEQTLRFRATALKDGRWPVVSETTIVVVVQPAQAAGR